MDHLIKGFTRVLRRIDDADDLISRFPTLEASILSDPSSISEQDRRRILDFPEPDMQLSNIAACSNSTKTELLNRAIESPSTLTTRELDLLIRRYWLDITRAEGRATITEHAAIPREDWGGIYEQLHKMRSPLYEPCEESAIESCHAEIGRRHRESRQQYENKMIETCLPHAHPWVRQLWEEDRHTQKSWGFPVFMDPQINKSSEEDYLARRDGCLAWAQMAISCSPVISARWLLQRLDWPSLTLEENDLPTKFEKLREQFNSLKNNSSSELEAGILLNVFLVIDSEAVESLFKQPSVDDMWVWAVDPDYKAGNDAEEEIDGYRGYFRVRIQQLSNNFYAARRFHASDPDYSMKALWKSAQKSKNHTFVSTRDEEARLWVFSRDVGSAMRPLR